MSKNAESDHPIVATRITAATYRELNELARRDFHSKGSIIRTAIQDYLLLQKVNARTANESGGER